MTKTLTALTALAVLLVGCSAANAAEVPAPHQDDKSFVSAYVDALTKGTPPPGTGTVHTVDELLLPPTP
jgi:nitrous oxide reductase accessory protein NosL